MNSMSWLLAKRVSSSRPAATELIQTHRARLALEEDQRAQQRRVELAELRSDRNPPDVRIRIWEERAACACQEHHAPDPRSDRRRTHLHYNEVGGAAGAPGATAYADDPAATHRFRMKTADVRTALQQRKNGLQLGRRPRLAHAKVGQYCT